MNNKTIYVGAAVVLIAAAVGYLAHRAQDDGKSLDSLVGVEDVGVVNRGDGSNGKLSEQGRQNRGTLQQQIRAAVEKKGALHPDVVSMLQVAETACANHRIATNKESPDYWPVQYLEEACKGFDSREFTIGIDGDVPDVIAVQKRSGADSAAKFAAGQIVSDEVDFSTKIVSGWYLIEHGAFPGRDQYKVDNDELARAFAGAVGMDLCSRLRSCQSQSPMTAGLCESMACAPGTTYEDALRMRLSGAEFETALKLRRGLLGQAL